MTTSLPGGGHPYVSIAILTAALFGSLAAGLACQRSDQDNPALRAFVSHVDREWGADSEQQSSSAQALRLLANAIESTAATIAQPRVDVHSDVQRLREQAETFASGTPDDLQQAGRLQVAFSTAADAIERITDAHDQEVERRLSAMRRSADSLDLKQPLRRQSDVIERFFHQAAEALAAPAQ